MNSRIIEIDRAQHPFAHVLRANPQKKRLPPRKPGETLVVTDLFSGAGGTTSGLIRSLASTGRSVSLLAINHWQVACDTMLANYPDAQVYNASVEVVDPAQAVPGGRIDLLVASPECIQYSPARGNRPIYDQSRSSAAFIYEWLAHPDVYVDTFILENVPLWSSWGPLDENLRPIKEREGEYFNSFLHELRKIGYDVDYKVLDAASMGEATSRRRLFVLGRLDGQPVLFPEPTHAEKPTRGKDGKMLKKWRSARSIINWDVRGKSIFNRKEGPHSPKSLKRMRGGFAKQTTPLAAAYVEAIDRFIPIAEAFQKEAKRAEALHTNTTKDGRAARAAAKTAAIAEAQAALFEAFLTPVGTYTRSDLKTTTVDDFVIANRNNAGSRTDSAMPALTTATGGGIAAVSSMILGQHGNAAARDTDEPIPTICTAGKISKFDGTIEAVGPTTEGFIFPVNHGGGENRTQSYDQILGTLTTKGSNAKADPVILPADSFLAPLYGEKKNGKTRACNDLDAPVPVITTTPRHSVVEPFIAEQRAFFDDAKLTYASRGLEAPLSVVGGHTNHHALIDPTLTPEPFVSHLRGYFGDARVLRASSDTDAPLDTIAASGNHHGLVESDLLPVAPTEAVDPNVTGFGEGGEGAVALPVDDLSAARDLETDFDRESNQPTPSANRPIRPWIMVDDRRFDLDVLFRMLMNEELAKASGFITDKYDYTFTGSTQDVTRQIGNAVPVHLAQALVSTQLRFYIDPSHKRKGRVRQTMVEPSQKEAA
jgi:DNA (cytosine-5)-methyltransferase 1